MKILHINYSELNGGAAIGANRLHQALLKLNINSEMLVVERCTIEPFIHRIFYILNQNYLLLSDTYQNQTSLEIK